MRIKGKPLSLPPWQRLFTRGLLKVKDHQAPVVERAWDRAVERSRRERGLRQTQP